MSWQVVYVCVLSSFVHPAKDRVPLWCVLRKGLYD